MKFLFFSLLCLWSATGWSQNIESFGVYGGFNIPFTVDQGLRNDPRFYGRFTLRGTPIGFTYGYDRVGHGILVTPGYMQIGQQFTVINALGGAVGKRDVKMDYFSVPVALKLHLNDIAFFRLSLVAAVNVSYLVKGQETWSVSGLPSARQLAYPVGVTAPTGAGYQVAYDGVYVPTLNNSVIVSSDKYAKLQIFAGVGFHSDFDLNDNWSVNFDGRANFGIFDPRSTSYLNTLKHPSAQTPDAFHNPGAPELYGQRRDIYLSASFGISRIIQIKEKFHEKRTAPRKPGAPKSKARKPRRG